MIVTAEPSEFQNFLAKIRQDGGTVGLHPTMGALHGGHKANIRRAAAECDVAAVTIYVNPLQFGPAEDFAAYPRRLEDDLAAAEEAGAAVVFAPAHATLFPHGDPLATVEVAQVTALWEGAHRPGHFRGVATIVAKLLSLAGPCYAYFGEKDYQQLVVVRRLVDDLSLPAVVVPCMTVREPDGLALSSRNAYLDDDERRAAPHLYWSLLAGKRAIEEDGATDPATVRQAMERVMERQSVFKLEYAAVVVPEDLTCLPRVQGPARLLVAARCPSARLIDNIGAGESAEAAA